ncbi:MAG: alanine racemase [Micrococcales bacterium]|nr:alanine racemase [Micrococcales bacterium]
MNLPFAGKPPGAGQPSPNAADGGRALAGGRLGSTGGGTAEATFLHPASRAVVSLDAITANTRRLKELAGQAQVMAVVKANGYGHGMVASARAAMAGGAGYLGVAQLAEALELHRALAWPRPPILSWIYPAGAIDLLGQGLASQIELGVSLPEQLDGIGQAVKQTGQVARLHLKLDTGLGRAGGPAASWEALVRAALAAQAEGLVELAAMWTHFAYADSPNHPTVLAQEAAFAEGMALAQRLGARFELAHVANSAALLTGRPCRYDMVRPGLAMYGLSPIPDQASSGELGLVPAMTLESEFTLVKRLPQGHGVSYGHMYHTPGDTVVGLVPMGYAEGVFRHASNRAEVWVAGRRVPVAGRICMDQFVVDLGPGAGEAAGERVVLFGPGHNGEPTAQEWAEVAGTISYEIVTRIPQHVPRVYVGGGAG